MTHYTSPTGRQAQAAPLDNAQVRPTPSRATKVRSFHSGTLLLQTPHNFSAIPTNRAAGTIYPINCNRLQTMRTLSRYIVATLAATSLAFCVLWLPGWSPRMGVADNVVFQAPFVLGRFHENYIARPWQAIHAPFVLVRIYRQRRGDYQAPLIRYSGGQEVPNSYSVHLHPGYSLEEHKRFVGAAVELERHIVFEFKFSPGYHAEELDDAMLRAVRADVGVDRVVPDREFKNEDPLDDYDYDSEEHQAIVASLIAEAFESEVEDQKTRS